jgi:hypothetical protein
MIVPEKFPEGFVPDWDNAPKWAKWWAMSPTDDPYMNSFRGRWFEVEPVIAKTRWGTECWSIPANKRDQEDYGFVDVPDWKAIKMQRPHKEQA